MKTITKKVNSLRVMKKFEDWYGLNKTTPDQWFLRWRLFIFDLFEEMGFEKINPTPIQKVFGKEWTQDLCFKHRLLGEYTVSLKRKRIEEGGDLWVFIKDQGTLIKTLSRPPKYSYDVMSRTEVGDKVLSVIRENWKHENTSDKNS